MFWWKGSCHIKNIASKVIKKNVTYLMLCSLDSVGWEFTTLHIQFSVPHHITIHFLYLHSYFTLSFSLVYMLWDWKGNSFKIRIWNGEWICFLLSSQGRTLFILLKSWLCFNRGKMWRNTFHPILWDPVARVQNLITKMNIFCLLNVTDCSSSSVQKHECLGRERNIKWL